MKKFVSLISSGLVLLALSLHAQGTLKVGTVDVRRILREYNKAKENADKIKDAANQARKELDERAGAYKKIDDEIADLGKQLESPALSADAKAQKTKDREDKLAKRQDLEQEISEFQRTRQRQIQDEALHVQEALLKDITDAIREKVKASNLDLVFDKSGPSISNIPELLFSRDSVDFTNDVIATLNKPGRTSAVTTEKPTSATTTEKASSATSTSASATPKKP